MSPPRLLNDITGARERIGIGRSMMYELLASGAIESVKIGKRRLIPEDALVAFVAGLRSDAAGSGGVVHNSLDQRRPPDDAFEEATEAKSEENLSRT